MKIRNSLRHLMQNESLNFWLTNGLPRRSVTRWMGRLSKVRVWPVPQVSMGLWRLFTDVDLGDAKKSRFESLHDCFTRELVEGARLVDRRASILSSPCDAIVGACGHVKRHAMLQIKGQTYALDDLLLDAALAAHFDGGTYVTLRLTSAMYHRFHAPHDGVVTRVRYLPGDVWNVNPPTLRRVPRLFCRNERAVIEMRIDADGHRLALVPVAAILVASLRLHFADLHLHIDYDGPSDVACDAKLVKGQEMGWFEHGSTIIVFAPRGFALADGIGTGQRIRMGQALLQTPE
ncbi:archaetidylserine decarboxylase [Variovorax sp. VNK109]|uniref:archaetidylserine decarboxylase n=1 Tax=Variovorax sp. VNK109 TaxID=3400919 RepID=UPI003C0C4284